MGKSDAVGAGQNFRIDQKEARVLDEKSGLDHAKDTKTTIFHEGRLQCKK